ncbi:MAG: DUF4959 domain-containing protein [Bacteroidales bacterium]
MKNILLWILPLLLITSCREKETDLDMPAPVQILDWTPITGGAIFTYELPEDENFLYVKAVYTLQTGTVMTKRSSLFSNTLTIDGIGGEKDYAIKLYSVNRSGKESAPVTVMVRTKEFSSNFVLESIRLIPGFSSVICTWENDTQALVNIVITFEVSENKEITKIYASNTGAGRYDVSNVEAKYHYYVQVKDQYGNITSKRDMGEVAPLEDYKLTKVVQSSTTGLDSLLWRALTQNELKEHANGTLKTAPHSALEGRIDRFFDDQIDVSSKQNFNYFHTGTAGYPFSYFIDLGKQVEVSRFRIHQRDYASSGSEFYAGSNVETFELYASNDLDNWELLREATIIKPNNEQIALLEARDGHLFVIDEDEPKFSKPFRYLQYKGKKGFVSSSGGCASEITLYGRYPDGVIPQ